MQTALRVAGLCLFLAALLCAAEVAGIWKGAFDLNGSSVPLAFNLKTSGSGLTGTVEGLPTSPAEIHDGKVDGDTITFWLMTDYEGQTYMLVYEGKVSGDQIQLTFGTEDGGWGAGLSAKKTP